MSLETRIWEEVKQRTGASESQLKALAQGELRQFSEALRKIERSLEAKTPTQQSFEIKTELVELKNDPVPVTPPPSLGGGGTSLPSADVFVSIAGVVTAGKIAFLPN